MKCMSTSKAFVCHGTVESATELYDILFANYSKSILPKCNTNTAVQLKLGIALRQILDLSWIDCRLTWNSTENGIQNLVVPYSQLWMPDITLYDNAENELGGVSDYRPTIYPDGSVYYNFPSVISSLCKVDVTYFPFDKQTCPLVFGSWASHGFDLNITNTDVKMDTGAYKENGEWEILEVPAVRHEFFYGCCPEPYPDVTFYIKLQRRSRFYLMNLIFPCILMSSLAVLGFVLPPDSGEKVSLEITVLLSLSVFMLIVSETMPPTSETFPYIGMYFACAMLLVSLSCVMTVTVLNIHHRGGNGQRMPDWVRKVFLGWIAWFVLLRDKKHVSPIPANILSRKNSRVHASKMNDDDFVINEIPSLQTADTNLNIFQNSKDYKTLGENMRNHSDNTLAQDKEGLNILREQLDCMTGIQQYLEVKKSAEDIVEEWQTLAKVLDRLFFIFFILFQLISTTVIMGKTASEN
ncbi:hypothetical protein ACF0H5_013554 [Mactra antiquata]